jgi:hypothetical protein
MPNRAKEENQEDMGNHDDRDNGKMVIGENTPIRIGLILGFLTIFASSIWWASSINSKLDSILSFNSSVNASITELKANDALMSKELSDFRLKEALNEASLKIIQDKISVIKN